MNTNRIPPDVIGAAQTRIRQAQQAGHPCRIVASDVERVGHGTYRYTLTLSGRHGGEFTHTSIHPPIPHRRGELRSTVVRLSRSGPTPYGRRTSRSVAPRDNVVAMRASNERSLFRKEFPGSVSLHRMLRMLAEHGDEGEKPARLRMLTELGIR